MAERTRLLERGASRDHTENVMALKRRMLLITPILNDLFGRE